jgi:hypothetical protein
VVPGQLKRDRKGQLCDHDRSRLDDGARFEWLVRIPDGCGKSARLIVGKTAATTDGTYGRLKCKTFANPERPCTTRWPCPTCRVHCQHECDVVLNRRARV